MGQAKRRGNYEQRRDEAVKRDALARIAAREAKAKRERDEKFSAIKFKIENRHIPRMREKIRREEARHRSGGFPRHSRLMLLSLAASLSIF